VSPPHQGTADKRVITPIIELFQNKVYGWVHGNVHGQADRPAEKPADRRITPRRAARPARSRIFNHLRQTCESQGPVTLLRAPAKGVAPWLRIVNPPQPTPGFRLPATSIP